MVARAFAGARRCGSKHSLDIPTIRWQKAVALVFPGFNANAAGNHSKL